MAYCIYLRKSRADQEAEMQGAGDTLKRHETALTALAAARNLSVTHIYREIVSGDTISSRPQMQLLLADIEKGMWEGVLCMEIERLARGDTIDQGIVAQTFKYTGTRIITPQKVYDPANDIDEEYFEFSLFMARREYKAIKRRMQAGVQASLREGNYIPPQAPYGYDRERLPGRGSRWHLVVNPDEAVVVKNIYEWYEHGIDGQQVGYRRIATKLNAMGLRTKQGNYFAENTIARILTNPTYCGHICWGQHVMQTTIKNGQRVQRSKSMQPNIMHENAHEAIITQEQFDRLQAQIRSHVNPSSTRKEHTDRNPFRGLIYCGVCGHLMQRSTSTSMLKYEYLQCKTYNCPTAITRLDKVEESILQILRQISALGQNLSIDARLEESVSQSQDLTASLNARKEQLLRQRQRIQELLETNVYDVDTYLSRNSEITKQLDAINHELEVAANTAPASGYTRKQITAVTNFLSEFSLSAAPAEKQRMLSSIIDKIVYTRIRPSTKRKADKFVPLTLDIHLKSF